MIIVETLQLHYKNHAKSHAIVSQFNKHAANTTNPKIHKTSADVNVEVLLRVQKVTKETWLFIVVRGTNNDLMPRLLYLTELVFFSWYF